MVQDAHYSNEQIARLERVQQEIEDKIAAFLKVEFNLNVLDHESTKWALYRLSDAILEAKAEK